jgi:hypothetical protein
MKQLNDIIDNRLPGPPLFQRKEVNIGDECLDFYCRDTLQCIRTLYGDPAFVLDLAFAPVQHYTGVDQGCRIINEMHTADWWWSTQVRSIMYDEHGVLQNFPGVP